MNGAFRALRLKTASGELAALECGDRDARPVLALHGWLDNAASFARLAPLLAPDRRVVALDLPGHGQSAHLPETCARYHNIDQVEVVLGAADALGLARFDLLGHSLGAGIASLTAAAAPGRIGKLALIEGLGPLADDGTATLARWRDAHAGRGSPRRPGRLFPSLAAAIAARVAAGGLDAEEARPLVERSLVEFDGGFRWCSDARLRQPTPLRIEEAQLRRLLAGIDAPTLLLLAEPATPYLPGALMAARAACVAKIRIEHMEGSHHLHVQHPRAVAARLLAFFTAGDDAQPR